MMQPYVTIGIVALAMFILGFFGGYIYNTAQLSQCPENKIYIRGVCYDKDYVSVCEAEKDVYMLKSSLINISMGR